MLNPLIVAIQFLTRLPIAAPTFYDESDVGKSLLYYPLVGLIIGVILSLSYALLHDYIAGGLLAAVLLSIWVLITGALHLDGLADSADAWIGGMGDRQKTLDIMKDPRCGPMAVVVICLTLILKFTALEQILAMQQSQILILAPVLGRTAIIALFLSTDYVRPGGLGEHLIKALPRNTAKQVVAVVLVIIFFFDYGFWLILGSGICFFVLRMLMQKRLQGTTGDTAGAMVEVVELGVLMTMAVCVY